MFSKTNPKRIVIITISTILAVLIAIIALWFLMAKPYKPHTFYFNTNENTSVYTDPITVPHELISVSPAQFQFPWGTTVHFEMPDEHLAFMGKVANEAACMPELTKTLDVDFTDLSEYSGYIAINAKIDGNNFVVTHEGIYETDDVETEYKKEFEFSIPSGLAIEIEQ